MTNSPSSSISNDKLLQAKIEAALYAAGRPLSKFELAKACLLYTSPSPRDGLLSRMPSSA